MNEDSVLDDQLEREDEVLTPGNKVIITVSAPELVEEFNWVIIKHDNGLLHVERDGESKVYNMRSTAFHSVRSQSKPW
jgi:hypothetical protein